MRKLFDLAVLEMLPAGEDAAKQNRSVDRRYFGVPNSLAGVDIREMIEKAAMVRQLIVQEPESCKDARFGFGARNIPAHISYTERGQTKTSGRNAGDNGVIARGPTGVAAVFYQTSIGAGLLEEIAAGQAF